MDVICCILGCGETESYKLLEAARFGDVEVAKQVVDKNPKKAWSASQWGGQTAWAIAAKEGHVEVIKAMADSIRAADEAALKALWPLGRTADEILQQLVRIEDSKGLTPLHMACIKGKAEACELLMQLGADPFVMDSVGRTPLHYAASWGYADCINAVLGYHSGPAKEGWSVKWPNDEETRLVDVCNAAGFTPLHYAVWVGRKDAIQALASYDASLTVTNVANDFEWIRVGTGNTPLHLAAFGGDFEVVKLLLAVYVQTLSAGREVMSAGRGQWGERHTDDVRHMRNRRGWMAYHIAIHKGYQNLAELLHPDIPYTFIFSNDDMEPGTVRMFGPARLMVIAAKALQQKLIDELEAVDKQEAAAEAVPPAATAAAAVATTAGSKGTVVAEQQSASNTAAVAATPAAAAAAAAAPNGEELATAAPSAAAAASATPTGFVSPFAARSQKGWTQSSFSAGTSSARSSLTATSRDAPAGPASTSATPASSTGAAAVQPVQQGSITPLLGPDSSSSTPHRTSLEARDPSSGAAAATAAATAAAATVAAAAARKVDLPAEEREHSFGPEVAAGAQLAANPSAPPTLLTLGDDASSSTRISGSFAGFAPPQPRQQQQQIQQQGSNKVFTLIPVSSGGRGAAGNASAVQQQGGADSASVSEAGMSNSTVPGSVSAVAGTPPGSVIMSTTDSSSHKLPQSTLLTSMGQPSSGGAAAHGAQNESSRGVQWAPSGSNSPTGWQLQQQQQQQHLQQSGIHGTSSHSPVAAAAHAAGHHDHRHRFAGRHRRVQSAAEGRYMSQQQQQQLHQRPGQPWGDAGAGRGGEDQQQQQPGGSRPQWTRMDSLKRRQSKKEPLGDMLPPSTVHTTAADDTDDAPRQQADASHISRRTSVQTSPGAVRGPVTAPRRISSLPDRIGSRFGSTTAPAAGGAAPGAADAAAADEAGLAEEGSVVQEDPLNIVLASRANQIGDNPEAIRQQLLAMKLASGAANFNHAMSAFTASLANSGSEGPGSAFASFSSQAQRAVLASRPPAAAAAAACNGAAPFESPGLAPSRGASPAQQQQQQRDGCDDSVEQQTPFRDVQEPQQQQATLSTSPSLFNLAAVNVITQQPSQSLQRLLSGNLRTRRSNALLLQSTSTLSVIAGEAPGQQLQAAGAESSAGAAAAPGPLANGELPMIQQQPPVASAAALLEDDGEDDDTCEICFDAAAIVALQRCGHTLCVSCCKELCKLHHFKPGLCPYCRQIICGFSRATCTFIP